MKTYKTLLVFFFFVFAISCENAEINQTEFNALAIPSEDMQLSSTQNLQEPEITDRKLIKEGFIEFETDDLAQTKEQIYKAIKISGAYISSESEQKSDYRISTNIVVRMPAENFDSFITQATQGVTKFDTKDISAKDVTEEFLDIQARIKTKKALENRYIELVKKANEIKDILEIERQINKLRTEIERVEGRLNYLKNRVTYSTLSISYYKNFATENSFGSQFSDGFSSGWDNLIWFFVSITYLWPFILVALLLIFGVKIYRRRKRN